MGLRINANNMIQDSRIKTAQNLNKKGKELFNEGKIQEAYDAFIKAVELNPDHAIAKNNLGVFYKHTDQPRKAVEYFLDALKSDPDNPIIVFNCGKLLEMFGRVEEAKEIYLSYLNKRYDRDISGSLSDLEKNVLSLKAGKRDRRKPVKNQVVFVSDMPRSREAKLAYGLWHAGWKVILLYQKAPTFDPDKYCTETHQYKDIPQLLKLAFSYNPVAYHVFSCWSFLSAAILIRNRPGKIVFDDYDVMAGMLKEEVARVQYPGQMELERFCLENADGLCCRSLETQYAKQHLGYQYQGKRIFLADSCWANHTIPNQPRPQITDDFHIVYCGNMPAKINKSKYDVFWLAKTLAAQKIHFHIYPSFGWVEGFKDTASAYRELANMTPFFKLHNSVPPDKLIEELSQYDVGWMDIRFFTDPYNVTYIYDDRKTGYYGPGNKIFDYVDAGLPFIINLPLFQEWLWKRVSVGVKINDEFINNPKQYLSRFDWGLIRKTVIQARSEYAVTKQAQRLAAFYKTL